MSIDLRISELEGEGIYLWEESGKLKYRAKEGAMNQETMIWLKQNKEKILEHLKNRKTLRHDEAGRYEAFPLTAMQKAYMIGRGAGYELGGTGCHSYTEFRLRRIDAEKMERAWHKLIQRHDMLRAVFSEDGMQRVMENPVLPAMEIHDFRETPGPEAQKAFESVREKWENRDYKIGEWPMHAFGVCQMPESSILLFSIDMLIADFVSVNVMVSELLKLYDNPETELPRQELTFRDMVLEDLRTEEERRAGSKYQAAKAYWADKIAKMGGAPALPVLDDPEKTVGFRRKTRSMEPARWARIKTIAKEYGVTASAAVLTAYTETLSRWSSKQNFCLNMTMMDRKRDYLEQNEVVGDFTTVNVFHADTGRECFLTRAVRNQQTLMEDLQHREFSGMEVLKELSRRKQEKILIPVVYTSTLGSPEDETISGEAEMIYGVSRTPQVWIDCQTIESAGRLVVNWDVRRGIFEKNVIEEMFECFWNAVEALAQERQNWKKQFLTRLPLETVETRRDRNATDREIPEKCLFEGFLKHLRTQPDKAALAVRGTVYSYKELAGYVQAVSENLKKIGIKPGDKVAIIEEKSVWQIASVLAVLIEGGVYVPIAVSQPCARKQSILDDADAVCVIGREEIPAVQAHFLNLEELKPAAEAQLYPAAINPSDTAYIIFTSGSTGRPKGVVITHREAMNTIQDINERFGIGGDDVILGVSALTFDLSVYDIFGAFEAGAALVLPDAGKEKSPAHWGELIEKYHVTVWNSVPALLSMLTDYRKSLGLEKWKGMKCIMLSGDFIPRTFPKEIRTVFEGCRIYSLGGATEGSIWSIWYPITDYEEDANIPYGIPLANQRFYVLDDLDRECPDGVIGEICIGGKGVAEGYYGDEELTAQKFYMHDTIGSRIYRTGDLGRYRKDGILEFIGRKDFQVKVNGHRIELGEIEHALMQHPKVENAVAAVFAGTDGRKSLEAFVVPVKETGGNRTDSGEDSRIREQAEKAAAGALEGRTKEMILAWKECSERTAVTDMLWVFRSVGLFAADTAYSAEEIQNAVRPGEEFEHIVKRWLNVLCKEKLLVQENGGYRLTEQGRNREDHNRAWEAFEALEEQVHYSRDLFDYQKQSADLLLQQIRGEVRGLDLFFPQGETKVAEAAYQGNVVNKMLNEAVKAAMIEIVSRKQEKYGRRIEILEIGAGVGGTTKIVVPALKPFEVGYRFTDVSNFFLAKAKETYRDYDFMSYGLYDINQPFEEQGLSAGSFDVILCANVLHNAVNCPQVLEQIKRLLGSDGVLVMIDTTADSYSLLTSLELKGNLNHFEDIRKDREQTFFGEEDWIEMFRNADLRTSASYPGTDDPINGIGQKMFVNVANADEAEIDEEQVKQFLGEYLLPYMIPARIRTLRELPLSANGKVDRKKLRPVQVKTEKKEIRQEQMSEKEKKIASIWKDLLQLESVGRTDNFYAVGGDSLLIAQVVTRMKEEMEELRDISWDELMRETLKDPSIAGIARLMERDAVHKETDMFHDSRCMHIYQEGDGRVVTAFFHAGTGRIRDYAKIAPELCERRKDRTVVGFTYGNEELYTMMPAEHLIETRAQVYANRLTELNAESYRLVGYCVGGFLAMETAKVLLERGCRVEPVVTISSHLCLHSIENRMLLECAYGVILGADVHRAGYRGDADKIRSALENILKGENRNVEDRELCALSGEFAELGEAFTALAGLNHEERMRRIYEAIETPDFNGTESTISMLNILYRIFEHTYKAMIHYKPDFFTGDLIALLPDEELLTSYPAMIPDTDWEEFVLGDLKKHVIHGNHITCIGDDRIEQIMPFLL